MESEVIKHSCIFGCVAKKMAISWSPETLEFTGEKY